LDIRVKCKKNPSNLAFDIREKYKTIFIWRSIFVARCEVRIM